RLSGAERAGLVLLAALAATLEPQGLAALLAVALVALLLRNGGAALRAALPAAVALLVAGAPAMRAVPLEGAVSRALEALCPTEGWAACAPPSRPAPGEAVDILAAAFAREPTALLLEATARAARQFATAGIGDTLGRPDAAPGTGDATPQARGELRRMAAPVAWLHLPVLVLATAFLLLAVLRARLRGDAPRLGLGAAILAAAGANALVTGALLGVEPRHQAGIAWLLPLAALLLRLPPRPGRPVEGYATENAPRGEVATQDLAPEPRADLAARPKPRG
ncbi:MAG: hypothetical protein K2X11_13465, partial [Acetobacteraceae bacterium]|nr:hypothetical protein [Acetobacteraceae bacterium]